MVAAATLRRHRLIARAAVVLGGGLAGLTLAAGLELLLIEQDVLLDSDGLGAALTFAVTPLAVLGAGLLGASIAGSPSGGRVRRS